ncbi:related to SNF1-related protein kinase KIN10 [Sporisorium reilianum f. sp. reilianum]|uniref:Related to SNF1-related protein kinase KIN10 n=1 Tax=Sporisorium reilianum f. sp. reilianum TaxID=72559 RepID=A0A2N8UF35_9BASI|nr:related to SNF1-related protein kinase KIN10 [Sporisorium reilianum f. sp. reilianum]
MFSRSRRTDAKRLSASLSGFHDASSSSSTSALEAPIPAASIDGAIPSTTATFQQHPGTSIPVHSPSPAVPTITTSSATPLSLSTSTLIPAGSSSPNTPVQAFSLASPPRLPHVAAVEPLDVSNSSFSVASLDSFGAISMAGSTTAAEDGSQAGSRFGASPPTSRLVAPRSELSSASIRSQRNWDQFEGKPVSPLPSPAVQNEQAKDMFDVPVASGSRHAPANGLATSARRVAPAPAPARTPSNDSLPSTSEARTMASPKAAPQQPEVASRNWSFFNSIPSGPPIARAPSIKTTNISTRAEHHGSSDSSGPTTPLSATAPRSGTTHASNLGHGHAARLASADLSNRIRVPSRLPTLPTEAAAGAGAGAGAGPSNMRSTSALYSQPQHFGYPRHSRISSGESTMSMDAALYSPLSAVDPHTGGDLFNFNSTSQLSLSGISDAPSATLDGLPPNVPWAPDSPNRIRSRSQLLMDDDRSAQSSPSSAVPGRVEHRSWRDAGDASIDSIGAVMPSAVRRASPAPVRPELYPAADPSRDPSTRDANRTNGAANHAHAHTHESGQEQDPSRLGHPTRRQGPSESATGSSIFPRPSRREDPSQPALGGPREEDEEDGRIGPYRIEKTLGIGAFSRVALGRLIRTSAGGFRSDRMIASLPELRQRALQKPRSTGDDADNARDSDELVALKMLDREPCNNNERLQVSWVREVEVLKHISHPNLVRFISSFSTPLHHTLVLERVAGGELFDALMSNFDRFAQREWLVRVIYTELANAIGWMHHINLVHRDIKLENILMSVDLFANASEPLRPHHLPAGPLIKLTDFGLSRFIDPSNPLLETRCGSEEYAAPELIIGKKYDGRKTDAWALGVVLYALITGSLPFMEDVNVGVNGAREGQGEERDPKQRKRHLLRIAKGDLRWPSPANDACADQPDAALCPPSRRLVTPVAKAMVARLLRRDATKRATPWETWDEQWLLGGSFGFSTTTTAAATATTMGTTTQHASTVPGQQEQVPNEVSAGGERLALHPDPRSQQGQHWLETHAAVRQDDVAPVAHDD